MNTFKILIVAAIAVLHQTTSMAAEECGGTRKLEWVAFPEVYPYCTAGAFSGRFTQNWRQKWRLETFGESGGAPLDSQSFFAYASGECKIETCDVSTIPGIPILVNEVAECVPEFHDRVVYVPGTDYYEAIVLGDMTAFGFSTICNGTDGDCALYDLIETRKKALCEKVNPEGPSEPGDPQEPVVPPGSPLVIDLDGHGFRFTDVETGVEFDIDADGTKEQVAWINPNSQDGFVVLDRDGNGVIQDGSELFGDNTEQPPSEAPNGFAALAVFDSTEHGGNEDGLISGDDEVFEYLQLWIDTDQDGVSQKTELQDLENAGMVSLVLDHKESKRRDRYGNELRYVSKAHFDSNPPKRLVTDVFLVTIEP
jgi:hypothetical protein